MARIYQAETTSLWNEFFTWKECCPESHPSSRATCLSVVSTPTPSPPRSSRRPSPYRPRKQKKLQSGHPCTLYPLYVSLYSTPLMLQHHNANSTTFISSTTWHNLIMPSSHSFASRPSKLQSCGSLPGAQQRPWGLESNGTRHNTSQGGSKKVATMIQNTYSIRLSHLQRPK